MEKILMRRACSTRVSRRLVLDTVSHIAARGYSEQMPEIAKDCPCLGGFSLHGTTQQHNTHIRDLGKICYAWHPWHGRTVRVHARLVKRGRAVAHCSLEEVQGQGPRGPHLPYRPFCCHSLKHLSSSSWLTDL